MREAERREAAALQYADSLEKKRKIDASRLKVYRILFYTDLIRRKPDLKAFIVGWIRRAMEA